MLDNGHGNQSYEERNNRPDNFGEQIFIDYCRHQGYKLHRIGFDEKQDKVEAFYNLSKTIRQLPDFVCIRPGTGRMAVVSVKGTNKFKEEDYNNLNWMDSAYGNPKAPLRFVFVIRGQVYWRTVAEVSEMYRKSTSEGQWPDGKTYRILEIG
jgi:hypothetical protein